MKIALNVFLVSTVFTGQVDLYDCPGVGAAAEKGSLNPGPKVKLPPRAPKRNINPPE
jgi:hypothetical protein